MQIVENTPALLIKISSNQFRQWCQLVDEVRVSTGLNEIEPIPEVRKLVDSEQIEEVQGSALVMLYCNRNISGFPLRQQLQEAYGNEARTLDIIHSEIREIEQEGITSTSDNNELRGRPSKKQQRQQLWRADN